MREITQHGTCALFALAALAVVLPAGARPALGVIWYVDAAVVTEGDGTSWGSPFKHLQCALAAASDGDDILVAGGTYYPDDGEGLTPGDQTLSFDILDEMELKGGYEGISGLPNNANDRTETSTLSGDIDDDGLDADNSQHRTFLFATPTSDRINILSTTPAVMTVQSKRIARRR